MGRISKSKLFSAKKADAVADIELINKYSVKELTPEDVYCFSVVLCDNDADRDNERFTNETLDALVPLFLGKTGISDHMWSADRQIARLYRVETEVTNEKNSLGEQRVVLLGSAYMLRNETNQPIIDAIDGGILKEVSVGCAISKTSCSICGEPMSFDWKTWEKACPNGHVKGSVCDGVLCVENLEKPTDAFEWSFVAVPAQKGAGVTKSTEQSIREAVDVLKDADLSEYGEMLAEKLMPKLHTAMESAEDRRKRAEIIERNKTFLRKEENHDSV